MSYFSVSKLPAFATALALTMSGAAHAQSTNPAWLDILTEQIAIEQMCAVELFIRIKETQKAGRNYYEARVQCADGRQFDAHRYENELFFTINICEESAICKDEARKHVPS